MKLDSQTLETFIIKHIEAFADENDLEYDVVSSDTRLFGASGLFDSMDLITFIVELEENLEDEYDVELTLTDEKAMSRRTSPFINPSALTAYILDLV